jgi:hypothetical protein
MDKPSQLIFLPKEIQETIYHNIPPKELLAKCSIDKSFDKMCKRNTFWEDYVKSRYNPNYYADENVLSAYNDEWEFFFDDSDIKKNSWKKLALWLEAANPVIQIHIKVAGNKVHAIANQKVPISGNDRILKYLERGCLSGPEFSVNLSKNVLSFHPSVGKYLDYDFPTVYSDTKIEDIYVDGINLIDCINTWLVV